MKTVNFQGIDYQVPDWARWIAQDANGTIKVFQAKPTQIGPIYGSLSLSQVLSGPGAPMVLMEVP